MIDVFISKVWWLRLKRHDSRNNAAHINCSQSHQDPPNCTKRSDEMQFLSGCRKFMKSLIVHQRSNAPRSPFSLASPFHVERKSESFPKLLSSNLQTSAGNREITIFVKHPSCWQKKHYNEYFFGNTMHENLLIFLCAFEDRSGMVCEVGDGKFNCWRRSFLARLPNLPNSPLSIVISCNALRLL